MGSEAVLTMDEAGRVRSGNEAAARILGVPLEVLEEGRELEALLGGAAAAAVRASVEACEVVAHRVDGVVLALGVARGAEGALRLTDLAHEAREGFPAVASETMRDAVHALRNPLAAALNSLDLVTRGIARPEDAPSLRKVTRNGLERIEGMLAQVHELALLGAACVAPADLVEIARAAIVKVGLRAEERRIVVALEGPATLPLRADAEPVVEALAALVANALEASRPGSPVTVALRRDERRREAVAVVRDEGEGIPAERLRDVFRMFYTTRKNASGVGLALARWVAAAHGGVVTLESSLARGTTATLRLPLG